MSNALAKVESGQIAAIQQILTQSTPKNEIRERKGRGGKMLKYTDGAYVIRTLNEAFGSDWDFEADNEELIYFNDLPFEVRCRGRLTVRMGGRTLVKSQYGCQPIEFIKDKDGNIIAPNSLGDAFKGAATDALKKCASMLGIALDLYDSDSEVNTGKSTPMPPKLQMPTVEPKQPVKKPTPQPKQGIVEIIADEDTPQNRLMALFRELKMNQAQVRAFLKNAVGLDKPEMQIYKLVDNLLPNEATDLLARLQAELQA